MRKEEGQLAKGGKRGGERVFFFPSPSGPKPPFHIPEN